MTNHQIRIVKVCVEEIIALRTKILRPAFADGDFLHFEQDRAKSTLHFGAFMDQKCVCCATFLQNAYPRDDKKGVAIQLRGMATDNDMQQKGIGGELLRAAIYELGRQYSGVILWCNARVSAVVFYQKLGFEIEGDVFEIGSVGEHYLMFYKL